MNEKIRELVEQIGKLEQELVTALHAQEAQMRYRIEGKKVEFEQTVREAHRRLKTGLIGWLLTSRPQNLLSAPFIYGFIVPLAIFDLGLTIYHAVCFPLYGIRKVRRGDYIVFDRAQLAYLNAFEKFHCAYCSYATGLIAYAREVAARTEQYWCPIKHARKVIGTHARYAQFLGYGEAEDYQKKLNEIRAALGREQ